MGSNSLTRDQTRATPALEEQSPSHWASREVLSSPKLLNSVLSIDVLISTLCILMSLYFKKSFVASVEQEEIKIHDQFVISNWKFIPTLKNFINSTDYINSTYFVENLKHPTIQKYSILTFWCMVPFFFFNKIFVLE